MPGPEFGRWSCHGSQRAWMTHWWPSTSASRHSSQSTLESGAGPNKLFDGGSNCSTPLWHWGRNFGFCDLLSKHRHAWCVKGGSHHGLHWRILTLRCAQWLANCTHSHSSLLWLFWYWGEDHDRDQEVARRVKGLNSAKWTHWQRARSFRRCWRMARGNAPTTIQAIGMLEPQHVTCCGWVSQQLVSWAARPDGCSLCPMLQI